MAQLWLIRHSRPVSMEGFCYGRTDIQTEPVPPIRDFYHSKLSSLPIIASPLTRCQELAKVLHRQFQSDVRLQEIDFGLWEGQRWSQLPRAEIEAWDQDIEGYQLGSQGESYRQLRERVLSAFADWQQQDKSMVWVTHAGVIRVILAEVLQLSVAQSLRIKLDYVSLSAVTGGEYPQVEMINQRIIQE